MTLRMADSIYASNLPAGYDAYLGYVDGAWPDSAAEAARFTAVPIISLAVFAADAAKATGTDIEPGDLSPSQAPQAVEAELAAGTWRPVCYASISEMQAVESALLAVGIQRSQVRLLSAHYGLGAHICGPAAINGTSCYPGAIQMDGTQWTSQAPGLNGSLIDESLLADDFFSGSPVTPVPQPPASVPPDRRNIYTPVTVDGIFGQLTCRAQQFTDFAGDTAQCDGIFGPLSKRAMQGYLGVTQDGIIGPVTVKALQAKVGCTQDGLWGPVTSASLQHHLNLGTY